MARGKKQTAWNEFWDRVEFIVGNFATAELIGARQTDDQIKLENALEEFFKTNPLTAQINAVSDIIRAAYNIGKTEQYRKPNQSLKDAAIELFRPFESVRDENVPD